MMNRFTLVAVAALTTSAAVPAAAAPIINGSFEQGVQPGAFTTLTAGSKAIVGWTVGNDVGGLDYIGSYWQAASGMRSLDLAGIGRGSIYQDVGTVIGQLYRLSFSLAGNPDGGPATKIAVVSIDGGDAQPFLFQNVPGITTRAAMGWQRFDYEFVASNTVSRVTFASGSGRLNAYGPALDDVSLSAVPEPATWAMMLIGFGMVGFGIRSRRKATVRVIYA